MFYFSPEKRLVYKSASVIRYSPCICCIYCILLLHITEVVPRRCDRMIVLVATNMVSL